MGQTLYLSPTGRPEHDGLSPSTPGTLGRLAALGRPEPGTRILLQKGAVFAGQDVPGDRGAVMMLDYERPFVGGYGPDDAPPPVLEHGDRIGLWYMGPGGGRVEGLVARGTGRAGFEVNSTEFWDCADMDLVNLEASGQLLAGLVVVALGGKEVRGLTVKGGHFHDAANGIHIDGGGGQYDDPRRVVGVVLQGVRCLHNDRENGQQSGYGLSAGSARGVRVFDSIFSDNGWLSQTHGHAGILFNAVEGGVVAGCTAERNKAGGAGSDGQGICVYQSRGVVVHGNVVGGNDLGGVAFMSGYRGTDAHDGTPCEDCVAFHNVLTGNVVGVSVIGPCRGVLVHRNQVVATGPWHKAFDFAGYDLRDVMVQGNEATAYGEALLLEAAAGTLSGVTFGGNGWTPSDRTPLAFRVGGVGDFDALEKAIAASVVVAA